jgi:hypothetical protein
MERAQQILDHYKASGNMKNNDMAHLIAIIADKVLNRNLGGRPKKEDKEVIDNG